MKRAATVLSVAAVALWSAGVFAQGRNFAGTWTIDGEKTAAAAAASGAGGVVTAGAGATGGAAVARSGGGGGGFGGGGGTSSGGAVAASGSGGAVMRSGGGGGSFAATGGGGGGRGGSTSALTITIDASTFRVGSGETGTSYRLDGVPTTTETPRGTSTMKATWKDDKLVIETTNPGPNGSSLSVATWYLEGDSLVRETSAILPDGTQTPARKTYYKKS